MTNIVYLYAEVMGYTLATIKGLAKNIDGNITVVHWVKGRLTPFNLNNIDRVQFIAKPERNVDKLVQILKDINPIILVTSGWMDKDYVEAIRRYKKINSLCKVVAGMDNQYTGSVRQHIGRLFYYINYKPLFDYIWVAGRKQHRFAEFLGYKDTSIISNLYSADTIKFSGSPTFSKRFLFVGRIEEIKNLEFLIEAFLSIPIFERKDWKLDLIGDGSKKEAYVEKYKDEAVRFYPFMQPPDLKKEVNNGGVFVLPSLAEPWGLVVHEMACSGFPLLIANTCGAASEFLINGYNGFLFSPSDSSALKKALQNTIGMSEEECMTFGQRSIDLSKRIDEEKSAFSLLSVLLN